MHLDPLILSRIQFAVTIGFHFLFPPTSIGLAWLLVWMEWKGWRGGDEEFARLAAFYAKLLGLTFALGVASGIVMEFQFGMNWARYSEFVGDVFGAPLAAEAVLAFFLESSFLGLYVFGRRRVAKPVHWLSCLLVALGATLSAFWILVANSWQQTPTGFIVRNGRAELTSFGEAVFSPSMLPRFFHQMCACLVVGAFLVAGVAAYHLLANKQAALARKGLRLGVIAGLLSALLVATISGHLHAQNVARYQPAKLAAMEGLAQTQRQAPLLLLGVPTATGVQYAVRLPGLLSLLATNRLDGEVQGLDAFPPADRPPVVIVFTSFHLMVGLGTLFILLMGAAAWFLYRNRLHEQRWLLWALVAAIPLPLAANELGWITAEVGRQPWIVYGYLRTADALSPTVKAGEVLASLVTFGLIYLLLGSLYVFLMVRAIKRGPAPAATTDPPHES